MTNDKKTVTASSDQLEHSLLTAWLHAADVGLCMLDSAGLVVMLNRAACSLLKVDGAQMLNQPSQEAVKEVDFEPGVADWLANPMFEDMSGYSSSELLSRNCRFLQGKEPHQPGLAAIRTAISSQSNGYAKRRHYCKDGSVSINDLFISPVKDAQGVVTHFVGTQHVESDGRVSASE